MVVVPAFMERIILSVKEDFKQIKPGKMLLGFGGGGFPGDKICVCGWGRKDTMIQRKLRCKG